MMGESSLEKIGSQADEHVVVAGARVVLAMLSAARATEGRVAPVWMNFVCEVSIDLVGVWEGALLRSTVI